MSLVSCWLGSMVGSMVDVVGRGVGSRTCEFWDDRRSLADLESLLAGEEQAAMIIPRSTNVDTSREVFLFMVV